MEKHIQTHGTRKRAVARAVLTQGTGIITINNQLLHSFSGPTNRLRISEPLVLAGDFAKSINVDIHVRGGGANGQADATRLAIARALVKYDPKLKSQFYEYDRLLLVADVRRKEVRKPNDSKARAARQKSYR